MASVDVNQRNALFRRVCFSRGQPCIMIIDSGSSNNLVATEMVDQLGLMRLDHPKPYIIKWVQQGHQLLVDEQCEVEFLIDKYEDKVMCDIVSMDVCDIMLGRPWQYDIDVKHYRRKNKYKFYKNGVKHKLLPIPTAGTIQTRSLVLKRVENSKEKEESGPSAKEAKRAKEEIVAQPPTEAAAVILVNEETPAESAVKSAREKAELEGKAEQ